MTTILNAIAAELNVPAEFIANVRTIDLMVICTVNGREYWSKLTATGKHKKNSVRLGCC